MDVRQRIRHLADQFRSFVDLTRHAELVGGVPLSFWIEVTNRCNLACSYCSSAMHPKRPRGNMSLETFELILGQVAPLLPVYVTLHLAGEPLLNPHLPEMIAMVRARGVQTTLSTNGMLLDADARRRLIDAGLDSIRIDFSTDREGYERHRRGAKWDRVHENIRGLLTEVRDRRLPRPRVLLEHISFPDRPSAGVAGLRELFKGLPVTRYEELTFHTWSGTYAAEQDDAGGRWTTLPQRRYVPCAQPWSALSITWDGKVAPCCRDLEAELVVGDIHKKDLMAIWNDKPLRRLRRKLARRHYADVPLCRHCSAPWEQIPPLQMAMVHLWMTLVARPLSIVRRLVGRPARRPGD